MSIGMIAQVLNTSNLRSSCSDLWMHSTNFVQNIVWTMFQCGPGHFAPCGPNPPGQWATLDLHQRQLFWALWSDDSECGMIWISWKSKRLYWKSGDCVNLIAGWRKRPSQAIPHLMGKIVSNILWRYTYRGIHVFGINFSNSHWTSI